ncbi:BnaC01g30710D [Brassica napus]|uniref:(rape) hypothetical protein n=1 Tax=Brassica napus TaxID=3708 RepID=A0A078F3F5_BRANA|nr:unnamed protein product [Brassica napus]CDY09020.1 BnaC01g30710D [Brassica napus]
MGITILLLDELEASTVTAGSGRALGFGFIVFANPSVAERMVMEKHIIDGRRLHRSRYPSGATEVFLQTGEQSGGSNQAPFWMSKLENQQQLLATPLMGGKRAIGNYLSFLLQNIIKLFSTFNSIKTDTSNINP